jgi:hypothetical protein
MVDSYERDFHIDRAISHGRDNAAVIGDVRGWCEHLSVQLLGVSMVGQMAGVPIGPHRLSCQYAQYGAEAVVLRPLFQNFLIENCKGCPHHKPGPSPDLGFALLTAAEQHHASAREAERLRRSQIDALRKELVSAANEYARTEQVQAASIFRLAVDLFEDEKNNAADALCEASKLAPELFDEKILNLLELGSSDEVFAAKCLPILASVATQSPSVRDRVRTRVADSIRLAIPIEAIAQALDACFGDTPHLLSDEAIGRLLDSPDYELPIGGWGEEGEPTYGNTVNLLVKVIDGDTARLAAHISARFEVDDKRTRANTCRIVDELCDARPAFGLEVLPPIIKSLELNDDAFGTLSADVSALGVLAKLLATQFDETHKILRSEIGKLSTDARAALIGAYERLFRLGRDWRETTHEGLDDHVVATVVSDCCELLCDAAEEPAVRRAAAEAIHSACRAGASCALDLFDQLLGCLALLLDSDRPLDTPKIILPGQEKTLAETEFVRRQERESDWARLKQELIEIIEEIGKQRPDEVGAALIATFDSAAVIGRNRLKNTALKLLGEAARYSQDLCLLALPTFMSALADYSSHSTRAVALSAIQTAFSRAGLTLPSNVVDLMVVHLRDQYVVVHKAAIKVFWFGGVPLTFQQRLEAFGSIVAIWRAYAQNPQESFFMDDVADALLAVSSDNAQLREVAIRLVCAYLPTQEVLVDSKLCETLVRASCVDGGADVFVAKALIACLVRHRREGYRGGRDWREDATEWLLDLPETEWRVVACEFTACARAVAQRDPVETTLFASVLCEHGDHAGEASVLLAGARAAKGHSLFHGLSKPLETLHRQAHRSSETPSDEA